MSVGATIARARELKRLLVVSVTGNEGSPRPCWDAANVAAELDRSANLEMLELTTGTADAAAFAAYQPVRELPAVFFISPDGTVLTALQGADATVSTKVQQALADSVLACSASAPPDGSTSVAETAPAVVASETAEDAASSKKEQDRQKVLRLQAQIRERRSARIVEGELSEVSAERSRRAEAKAVADAERQRKELAERRRATEAANEARELRKERALLARAKAAQKKGNSKSTEADDQQKSVKTVPATPTETAVGVPPRTDEALVLVRLPSHITLKQKFDPDSKLQDVHDFVVRSDAFNTLNGPASFRLVDSETGEVQRHLGRTLRQLGMVPRARLLLEFDRDPASGPGPTGEGACEWVQRMLQSAMQTVFGTGAVEGASAATAQPAETQMDERRARAERAQQFALRRRQVPERNFRTFRNPHDDDDPEKRKSAYNGNSQETLQ